MSKKNINIIFDFTPDGTNGIAYCTSDMNLNGIININLNHI